MDTSPYQRRLAVLLGLLVGHACSGSPRPSPREESVPPPSWMHGVWTREWIEVRGVRSRRFAVQYLQTPTLFADMRLPIERPSFSQATSFADLTDAHLLVLARQRGFTGVARPAAATFPCP